MRRSAFAAALVCAAALSAAAQTARPSIVRVHVVDSAGAPIAGANVSLVAGSQRVAVEGVTDGAGVRELRFDLPAGELDVVVRRLGFARADRFLALRDGDSTSLDVVLRRAAQTLATVNVTAGARLEAYHADADDIAASTRPLLDAMDVVTKLRPDMIYPRSGPGLDRCGLFDVWVNGSHVRLPPVDDEALAKTRMLRHGAAYATPHLGPQGIANVPPGVQSVLATIKPQHIAEMTYHDCSEASVDGIQRRNSLFVTLKPGIGFSPGIGSFVMSGDAAPGAFAVAQALARVDSTRRTPVITLRDRFRFRLLGVFDAASGAPIEDAEVTDMASGAWVRTPASGVVPLALLPPGESTVRLRRSGYADTLVRVAISPRDTTPITIALHKAP